MKKFDAIMIVILCCLMFFCGWFGHELHYLKNNEGLMIIHNEIKDLNRRIDIMQSNVNYNTRQINEWTR